MSADDPLDALVHRRDLESQKDLLRFLYAYWGTLNVVGVWAYTLVWPSLAFWALWIPAGIVGMAAVIRLKTKDLGRSLWDRIVVPQIWMVSLVVLPLLIWLFPEVLHLYEFSWIFPVTSAWVALAMFAAGAFNKQVVVAVGSLAFWLAAPVYLVWPEHSAWIFTASNALGLVLPGVLRPHGRR